jgi:tripartite-type tricarboxylate transporter receptor subunit TctC
MPTNQGVKPTTPAFNDSMRANVNVTHNCLRRALYALCFPLAVMAGLPGAYAQPSRDDGAYPARSVRLITPSSPGSGVDIVARIFAQKFTGLLGQQVIVDNRAGAGANLGAEIASKAPADGYTLFIATPAHSINSTLYSHLKYNILRDFLPVSLITTGQYIVVVHPSLPVKTIKELIAFARLKPDALSYGSGGRGNATHLAVELFNSMAGTRMLHVPYKGSGPALTDMISGQVQVMFANLTAGLPHVKSGRLRALATTGEKRSAIVPQLPTVAESGLPGYVVTSYYGILVPAGTSKDIIARLNTDTVKAMSAPDMRERLAGEGADPTSSTPEQFAAFLRSEIDKWGKVVKAANIRAE